MKAMILAAGRGERMRPLTDSCPKPLLRVAGKPLIVWHLERLVAAGFDDVVINLAHLGAQISQELGDGTAWGLNIRYTQESPGALETAGGIAHALPLLGGEPFLVINGDIFCDWHPVAPVLPDTTLAHLVLVSNPPQHPAGDFVLNGGKVGAGETACSAGGMECPAGDAAPGVTLPGRLTFAGIGIYRPQLFSCIAPGSVAKLAPLLRQAMATGQVSGEWYQGRWADVGTPQRLAALDAELVAALRGL